MIEVSDTSQTNVGGPTWEVGVTSAGRPIDWFTNEQVNKGVWREEEIAPEITGLSRPLIIYRGSRKTNLIVYDWHGDKQTFCPPMWWDLAIGSGACGLGCRACFLMLTHRIKRDPSRHLLHDNLDDFLHASEKCLLHSTDQEHLPLVVRLIDPDPLLIRGLF